MSKMLTNGFLVGILALLAGCQSIYVSHRNKPAPCRHDEPTLQRRVEISGEVANPQTFVLESGYPLSLRQSLIQAGGLKKTTEQVTIVPERTVPSEIKSNVSDEKSTSSRSILMSQVSKTFGDESQMQRLLRAKKQYLAPTTDSTDLVEYLQDVVVTMSMSLRLENPRPFDMSPVDSTSQELGELVQMLRYMVSELQVNDPEFASQALAVLDEINSFHSTSLSSASSTPLRLSPTDRTGLPRPRTPSTETPSATVPLLIGLENRRDSPIGRRTMFFHPELVYHTAIGDIPLRDGDFVYAIQASQTSLQGQINVQHMASIPVMGVRSDADMIDPSQFQTIDQVMQLKRQTLLEVGELVTLEDICMMTRLANGTTGVHIFYLPVDERIAANGSTTEPALLPLGSILPGDQFEFGYASRNPFVFERLVQPLRDHLEQRRMEEVRVRKKLVAPPMAGRFLSRWNSNIQNYMRPVVESARNLVR